MILNMKVIVKKNRNLSLDEYLNKITPYLKNIITDLQNSDTWKFQLTIAINFISSKDVGEERVMHSKSDNSKLTSYNDGILETSMRESDFIFDSVQLMYYKRHKVNFRRCGSYIDSPDWIKKKKATVNPKDEDDKCFQYAVTVA